MKRQSTISEIITDIKTRLQTIEDYMVWLVRPDDRFTIGQRVEWSRRGRRAGFPNRKIAQKGTVKKIASFSVTVQLDGYSKPRSFHHGFFNPVNGPKLF